MAQQFQSRKWFWFAILYQNIFAYVVALCISWAVWQPAL
jgi:ferrous iron transport protein B